MSTKAPRLARPREAGVTMIELIIFMVIIGIALAGIMTVMSLTTARSADPMRRKQALIIAEGVLEEVEQAKFTFCDPSDPNAGDRDAIQDNAPKCAIPENWGQKAPEPTGANYGRPYDNVNDYVNVCGELTGAFNNAAGELADATGRALNVSGYSVRVAIRPAVLGPDGAAFGDNRCAANTEVLRITVQVDYDGQSLTLDGYRARYAPYMQ